MKPPRPPWNQRKPDTKQTMIAVLVLSVPVFLVMWFVMGTFRDRLCATIVLPLADLFCVFSYFYEKRANRKAAVRKLDYLSGAYRRDPAWQEACYRYKHEKGYETCHPKGVRYDMLRRYRRKSEPVTWMLFSGFLLFSTIVAEMYQFHILFLLAFPLFGYLFWLSLSEFIGFPVRRWYHRYQNDPELAEWERAWQHGRILSYQAQGVTNGICLSAPYILLYDKKDVHTVELSVAESLTREIVRVKQYEDSLFTGDKYRFYAVLHIRAAQGNFTLKTELNEYQLELAVEEFERLCGLQTHQAAVQETFTNDTVM